MAYLQRIKHDLKAGWAALRYGAVQAANRALEETELLRLRLEIRKLDDRIRDIDREVGERAVELYDQGVPVDSILEDGEVLRATEAAAVLRAERAKLVQDMEQARSVDDDSR